LFLEKKLATDIPWRTLIVFLPKIKFIKPKTMDVYNLINSKTIGNYCREIKHQFNTLEIGILIYRCKTISIEKKMELYNEIINNPTLYSDMEVKGSHHIKGKRNAIDLIKMEVDRLDFLLKMFNESDEEAVFTLETLGIEYRGEKNWFDSRYIFKTLQDVNNQQNEDITSEDIEYRISKKYLNQENHCCITLEYKRGAQNNFELYDIHNDLTI
jgi:hypothetical protein